MTFQKQVAKCVLFSHILKRGRATGVYFITFILFSVFYSLCGVLLSCSVHLYADDVQLYLSGRPCNIEHTIQLINEDLERVVDWAERRGLKLNALKSQTIIIGSRRMLDSLDRQAMPKVKLGGEVINFTQTVKNLGVIMDEDMSRNHQCSSISRKVFYSLHSLVLTKTPEIFTPIHQMNPCPHPCPSTHRVRVC